MPRAAAADLGAAAAAARAVRSALDPRPRCRRSRWRSAKRRRRRRTRRAYALVLRILEPLTPDDEPRCWLHSRTPTASSSGCRPAAPRPCAAFRPRLRSTYPLPEFDGRRCRSRRPNSRRSMPTINRVLVRRAMALLDPQPGERIADFFCGLGNFTLPIARRGAHRRSASRAIATLVGARRRTRPRNGLRDRARFLAAESVRGDTGQRRRLGTARQARCIDPPREGAIELVKALPRCDARRPQADRLRVSARRRRSRATPRSLVHERGYRLRRRGRGQHVPAYRARRVDRRVRARELRAGDVRRKQGSRSCPFHSHARSLLC